MAQPQGMPQYDEGENMPIGMPIQNMQFVAIGPQLPKLNDKNFDLWYNDLETYLYIINADNLIQRPAEEIATELIDEAQMA